MTISQSDVRQDAGRPRLPGVAAGPDGAGPSAGPGSGPFDRDRRLRWVLGAIVPPVLLVVIMLLAWQLMAARMATPLVPRLGEIAGQFGGLLHTSGLWTQVGLTLERVGIGFVIGFLISVVVGIAMGRSTLLRRFLEPLMLLLLVIPGLVKALLCVIWFGVSLINPVLCVVLAVAPVLIMNIVQGVRSVDDQLVEMADVYRLPGRVRLFKLWLPVLAPYLFAAARLGISRAWQVIVLVEIFGLASGIGYQLNLDFSNNNVAGVLAWTITFALIMTIVEYGVFQTLERLSGRWRKEAGA
ncbi:ABC transporter permease [Microlunatus endophyticus]|uniref:ABC transporter permease n=1 Tax=Microlunatus endophyticus TaxID=1716077 RepID=A0A917SES0_9ACTN|nr:ABC transporter permease [Microlunatus endophyticus]GGL75633.1 ABC transporter permease [Microlunatus endophyticus]